MDVHEITEMYIEMVTVVLLMIFVAIVGIRVLLWKPKK